MVGYLRHGMGNVILFVGTAKDMRVWTMRKYSYIVPTVGLSRERSGGWEDIFKVF